MIDTKRVAPIKTNDLRYTAADVRYRMDKESADIVAYAADEIDQLRQDRNAVIEECIEAIKNVVCMHCGSDNTDRLIKRISAMKG